ncbi:MAG: hypothetical protein HOW97_08925, partial [Catenulispora sp.]|nr:hypothetical protein [Catenulispora sp.]
MRRYPVALSMAALSLIPLAGCTADGTSSKTAPSAVSSSSPTPSPPTTPIPATTPTTTPATAPPTTPPTDPCMAAGTVNSTPPPAWTAAARPPAGMRWVAGEHGLVVGMLFADPLKSAQDNKILWIVKLPRDGAPLQMRATLFGTRDSFALTPVPPDSGPGEIYPSMVPVPTPGCWILTMAWNGHQDSVA